jgi:hypothetical protein
MASSSLHYFVLSKEKRSKEILEWCLDGILLIPLANFRIFQEIQHRACQSFILEQIHHLDPGPTLPPALPAFPSLSRDPLNPLFEGKALPFPRAASAKQMPTRLLLPRVAPPTGIRLFLLYPHKVGPNEGVARGQSLRGVSLPTVVRATYRVLGSDSCFAQLFSFSDCAITIREGEKLSSCKLYDMTKEQLNTLRQILDENQKKTTGPIQPPPMTLAEEDGKEGKGEDEIPGYWRPGAGMCASTSLLAGRRKGGDAVTVSSSMAG